MFLLSPYKSNLLQDISSRLRMLESSLRNSFMRLVPGVTNFWQSRKKMISQFYFQTARAQRINRILKIMSKFMFSEMTQVYTQSGEQFHPINVDDLKYTIWNHCYKFQQGHTLYSRPKVRRYAFQWKVKLEFFESMQNKITKKYIFFFFHFRFKKKKKKEKKRKKDYATQKHFNSKKKEKEERKIRKKKKEKIKRKLVQRAIGILHTSHILSSIICRLCIYVLYKLFHIHNILSS